ncbi:MAG TPA: carboxymuconolactone decarboxylase family protein [Burkholderiaceae bacterium]
MQQARIVPLNPPYDAETAAALQAVMPQGMEPLKLFRTQARNLRVFKRMAAGNLLDKGSISLRERELLILRTCARCGAEYEWGVHVALFAERAKLDQTALAATLEQGTSAGLTEPERLLLRAADALHDSADLPNALWQELEKHYSSEQLLEIIALVGFYHAISFVVNATRVELEPFAPRFPVK